MPPSQTKMLKLAEHPFGYVVEAAFQVLMRGGIVALPTDTIYGVLTLLKHSEKLYQLKNRPQNKPLGLFVTSPEEIPKYADLSVSPELTRSLLPGPVTLIFNRTASLPSFFNAGEEKVGVRVPDTPLVQAICELLGEPLAQTSANVSGSSFNPMKVADFEELHSEIDLIIDGGEIAKESAPGSTIVDLSHSGSYKIVRDGCARKNTENLLHEFGLVRSSNL